MLEGRVLEHGEEVKRSEGKLVPVREQLEKAEGQRKGVRRVGEGESERLQEREKELEMVERLDTEILAYRDQGEDGQLLRLKEEKMELEKELAKMKQPAALPGHLSLQAAHLGPDLLLQPPDHLLGLALPGQLPVTCQAGRGRKKTQVTDFQNRKALSHP